MATAPQKRCRVARGDRFRCRGGRRRDRHRPWRRRQARAVRLPPCQPRPFPARRQPAHLAAHNPVPTPITGRADTAAEPDPDGGSRSLSARVPRSRAAVLGRGGAPPPAFPVVGPSARLYSGRRCEKPPIRRQLCSLVFLGSLAARRLVRRSGRRSRSGARRRRPPATPRPARFLRGCRRALIGPVRGHRRQLDENSGVPWDARYRYFTKGWVNNWGYGRRRRLVGPASTCASATAQGSSRPSSTTR